MGNRDREILVTDYRIAVNSPYTGNVELIFCPGDAPAWRLPLARFLPPLESGMVSRALKGFGEVGDLVLDPFGVSPGLLLEAARSGRRVLAAVNNPITRFIIEHSLRPLEAATLQSCLAALGSAPKDGSRLEPFLLDLYRTRCSRCGAAVSCEYFIWDREAKVPILKAYSCPHCNHVAEEVADAEDIALAQAYARRGLYFAQALEEVAPAGDPDRSHAEAALSVYTGRSLYALITIITKLRQLHLTAPLSDAARALMLAAFDAGNALWGHPEGRIRPRQLSLSAQFRETNVWRAMERAVAEWSAEQGTYRITSWPAEGVPAAGEVALFAGTARELARTLSGLKVDALLTVLPRPNQAYWTLSALWATWLWDREAALPIKVALRRRRYDWGWHAGALRAALSGAAGILRPGTDALAFLPEAEPGFVAAALAGLDGAAFELEGVAVRFDEGVAMLHWKASTPAPQPGDQQDFSQDIRRVVSHTLQHRKEPTPYPMLHAAVCADLAKSRKLASLLSVPGQGAVGIVNAALHKVLETSSQLTRLDQRSEIESGLFWLKPPPFVMFDCAMDRVEAALVDVLRQKGEVSLGEFDAEVCSRMAGFETPDARLILAGLQSYALQDSEDGRWRLREEDRAEARSEDVKEMLRLLGQIAEHLGLVREGENPTLWREEGRPLIAFRVQETAALSGPWLEDPQSLDCFVLPGGRAPLISERLRRDPRVRGWMHGRPRLVKFRHLRRLSEEGTLTRENLMSKLAMDPAEHEDPQMALL